MSTIKKVSGDEIVERIGSSSVSKALRLMGLTNILRDSIIADTYTPSDALFESIRLTARGQSIARRVSIENPSRPKGGNQRTTPAKYPRESQLMCLLELGVGEPLIDLEATDIEAVREAISAEVQNKSVRHPYIFGPTLYNKAADLFPDLQPELSYQQTVDLLEGTEQGVFQTQEWLTGPLGIFSVAERRALSPVTRVPLQHCNDISCSAAHDTWLRTSRLAAINSRRELIQKYLTSDSDQHEWEWVEAFKLVAEEDPRFFRDDVQANLLPLIGDGLSPHEKQRVLQRLIEANQEDFRAFGQHRSGMRDAGSYAGSLSEAQCLQEILWFRDGDISKTLDELILSSPEVIRIPPGEIRRTVLVNAGGYGYYRTRVELSRHGFRIVGPRDIAPLRLDRSLDAIYGEDPAKGDVAWKLRQYEGAEVSDKIDAALRQGKLLGLIEALMADSRHHALKSCEAVGLDPEHVSQVDLPELLAWKLGFDIPLHGDLFAQFEDESRRFQDEIASQTSSFFLRDIGTASFDQTGAVRRNRGMREAGSSYFVMLEHVLSELVAFSSWALLANHFGDRNPFQYDPREAMVFTVGELNQLLPPDKALSVEGSTLGAYIEAVGVLAKRLDPSHSSQVGDDLPDSYVPEVARKSSLVKFPFTTTAMFDSLSEESKQVTYELLLKAHRGLVDSKIAFFRNSQLHYRPNSAESAEIGMSVNKVLGVMRTLDNAGLMPALSSLTEVQSGRWGRRTYVHSVGSRRRIELHSPTSLFSGLLPSRRADQLIIPQARLNLENEPLRFSLRTSSEYSSMWTSVPNRRRRRFSETSAVEGLGIGEGARGL